MVRNTQALRWSERKQNFFTMQSENKYPLNTQDREAVALDAGRSATHLPHISQVLQSCKISPIRAGLAAMALDCRLWSGMHNRRLSLVRPSITQTEKNFSVLVLQISFIPNLHPQTQKTQEPHLLFDQHHD